MAEFFDIEMEDFEDDPSPADILNQDEAIEQSLKIFLISSPNDFIYSENTGGVIKSLLFRRLSFSNLEAARFKIKNAIYKNFSPRIDVLDIRIERDNIKRAWAIQIIFQSPISNTVRNVQLFVKDLSDRQQKQKMVEIPYSGNNLTNFARLQKFKYPNERLRIENNEYFFGNFKLINFNRFSENFEEVQQILGTN